MKKLLTMILIFTMVFTLTACAEKEPEKVIDVTSMGTSDLTVAEAKAMYDEAAKNILELTSMDVTSITNIRMNQGTNEIGAKFNLNIKVSDMNKESMKYAAMGIIQTEGEELETSIYYENGYCYLNYLGGKVRYAGDITTIMETMKTGTQGTGLDSSYMKDITIKKDGDNEIITYKVYVQKMDSYVHKMMRELGYDLDGTNYSIKEVKGEATINKAGYITRSKMNLTLRIKKWREMSLFTFDTDITYNNPGQAVEVIIPDLEGYEEVDPSTLGIQ